MSSVGISAAGALAAILFLLDAGRSGLVKRPNKDLKAYTLFPGVGYFQKMTNSAAFNWTRAFETCVEQGGHLAVPNSVAEAEVYKQIIEGTEATYQDTVFIGFHDLFVDGEYETVHDYPVAKSGYDQWALGAPNVDPNLRCGGFNKSGGLLNLNCVTDTPSMFICERPLWSDYNLAPGVGYYKFHVDAKTWPEAWQTCRDEDSHLAVINSIEEHQALQEIFTFYPNIPAADNEVMAWVGVHAYFAYSKFRTVLGTSLDDAGYSTWVGGGPGPGLSLGFTSVALLNNNGSLEVWSKASKLAFFCEHEL